jgi:hypothetical protein
VEKDGHGGRTFYDRAQQVYQFLQTQGGSLLDIPSLVCFTNHETEDPTGTTRGTYKPKKTAGGTGPGFHCAADLRIKKVSPIATATREGWNLRIKTFFNSLGPSDRQIMVPYIEGFNDDKGEQVDYFDWGAALVDLLVELLSGTSRRDAIQNVLGSLVEVPKSGYGKMYSCHRLNITREMIANESERDNQYDASRVGAMLESDPTIVAELQKALRLDMKTLWEPGLTFDGTSK